MTPVWSTFPTRGNFSFLSVGNRNVRGSLSWVFAPAHNRFPSLPQAEDLPDVWLARLA